MEQLGFNPILDGSENERALGPSSKEGSSPENEKNKTDEHAPIAIHRIHCQYCEDTNPDCMYCHGEYVEKE